MTSTFSIIIIISGGFLYFITASLFLAERNKTAAHYIIMAFFFSTSIWQTGHGLSISQIILRYPHLAQLYIPFYYFTSPLLYFFFKILTRDNFEFKPVYMIHFLPGFIAFFMLVPFYMQPADKKLEFLLNLNKIGISYLLYPVFSILILLAVVSMTAYAAAFTVNFRRILKDKHIQLKKITAIPLVIIALNYSMIIIYVITFILRRYFSLDLYYFMNIFAFISILMSVQIYLFLIMRIRYPDYILQIDEEAKRIRYANTRIAGLDVNSVITELITLMETEKIFCDEDLTLARLAEELSITPYQLSQILNERLNKNFNSFINEYRIREAERYLTDEPDRNITSISYAAGFNSPATFYKSFAKTHDISPLKFREKFKK